MLEFEIGTIWTDSRRVATLLGSQPQDDGSQEYLLAGPGWVRSVEGVLTSHDGATWVQCDPSGAPLTPDSPPITD